MEWAWVKPNIKRRTCIVNVCTSLTLPSEAGLRTYDSVNWDTICSSHGLSPDQHKAITWKKKHACLMITGPSWIYFWEFGNTTEAFYFNLSIQILKWYLQNGIHFVQDPRKGLDKSGPWYEKIYFLVKPTFVCHMLNRALSWWSSITMNRHGDDQVHYSDVVMGAIASQNTSLTIVYSTVYSAADQRKH